LDITKDNLHDLIVKAMGGDDGAFEALYKANSKSILFNARNLLYNANDTEDVAQEIILQMYKSLPSLKSPYAFSAWMHRIIVNTCYRYNERNGGKPNGPSLDEEDVEVEDTDSDVSPEKSAEKAAQSEELMTAIRQLPEKQRISLIMHYYDEMKFSQIGEALNISEKTASSNVTKAKKNLKKILGSKNKIYGSTNGSGNGNSYGSSGGGSGTLEASFIAVTLKEEADKEFLSVNAERFWKGCDMRLSGYRAEHIAAKGATKAAVSGGKGTGIIVTLTVCLTVVITAGFLILGSPGAAREETSLSAASLSAEDAAQPGALPKVEIVFESEDDNPGNIDPKLATVKIDDSGYTAVSWSITAGAYNDGEEVLSGENSRIGDELKALPPGEYRLTWSIENTESHTATVYRDFTISS
jgi:RNA polymerase sigma-70 factor (ECF subfamily)